MVTTNTKNKIDYFRNTVIADFFIDNLFSVKDLYHYKLYAFVVNLDHVHLLLKSDQSSLLKIIQSIKRNFSLNINKIMGYNEIFERKVFLKKSSKNLLTENSNSRLINSLSEIIALDEKIKYNNDVYKSVISRDFPKFAWRKSFHGKVVKDKETLIRTCEYIHKNPSKHGITTNWQNYPWSSLNPEFSNMVDELPTKHLNK